MSSRLTRGLARSDSEIVLDEYLHGLGFWRKMIPKDGNCLFRIASEKLLGSQIFHEVIKELFESYHLHQRKLKVPESTSLFQFLSHLMKKDIKIFWNSSSEMKDCTSNNFDEKVILCTVDDKHFDLVYTLDYVNTSALCQSVLYEILYEGVFGVNNALDKSKDMMGVKTPITPKFPQNPFGHFNPDFMSPTDVLFPRTFIAFPYKVAKSLSVEILRNVEYDAWLEVKKARTYGCSTHFDKNVPLPGDKCQVTLEGHGDLTFNAHIQEVQKDKGIAVVFVEGLGQKQVVRTDAIKLLVKPNQFDYYWRKRAKKKSFDGCTSSNKSYFVPAMPTRSPMRTNRINSTGHMMNVPSIREGFHALKAIEEGCDDVEMFSIKERSCSEGHFRKEFRLECPEDENGFYELSPEDDEVLVEESHATAETSWNYPATAAAAAAAATTTTSTVEGQIRTGSSEGCPMSPEGTNVAEGVTNSPVQYSPNLYAPQSTYMVVPAPNGHILNYENYPGTINFSAAPSIDNTGSDLPSQDISTSRFFYNLGVLTYNGWLMVQNQMGQQSVQAISSSQSFICQSSSSGVYMATQPSAVVSPEYIVVANNESFANGGYMAGISPHAGAFYYPPTAPASPYIQVATPVQYHTVL